MSRPLTTVIVNGSLSSASRTRVLLNALHTRLGQELPLDTQVIDLVDLVQDIGPVLYRNQLPERALRALETIESADLLIIGSPVFRGSIPGLFKHLFDLVEQHALEGKPVLLAATGGSARHALVIEHQLRPLFAFFQTLTLPIGVYSTPEDIQDGQVVNAALRQRIDLTIELATPILNAYRRASTSPAPAPTVVALQAKAA